MAQIDRRARWMRRTLFVCFALAALSLYGQWNLAESLPPPQMEPALSAPVSAPPDSGALTRRLQLPAGRLKLSVEDDQGAPLPEARIAVRAPLGKAFEPLAGSTLIAEPSGTWQLQVTAEGFLPFEHTVTLMRDELRELPITLLRGLTIAGDLLTTDGRPVAATRVWFLGDGEIHPTGLAEAARRNWARTDSDGRFRSPLLEPGTYRLSCGPVGRARLEQAQARRLPGGTARVELRVPDRSQLVVEAVAGTAVDTPAQRWILLRALSDPSPHAREASLAAGGSERWLRYRAVRGSDHEPVRFHDLAPGEYRLRLITTEARWDSDRSIRIAAETKHQVVVHLPNELPPRNDDGGKALGRFDWIEQSSTAVAVEAASGVRWID